MNRNLIETLIGFLVLLIAAVFFFFSYKIADVRKLEKTYSLKAKFDQVEGISVGSDVAISGIKIGTVTDLSLDQSSYNAMMTLAIRDSVKIPYDSSAKIVSKGILGGKYVSIEAGSDNDVLENDDQIQYTQSSINLEGLISKFAFNGNKSKSKVQK